MKRKTRAGDVSAHRAHRVRSEGEEAAEGPEGTCHPEAALGRKCGPQGRQACTWEKERRGVVHLQMIMEESPGEKVGPVSSREEQASRGSEERTGSRLEERGMGYGVGHSLGRLRAKKRSEGRLQRRR